MARRLLEEGQTMQRARRISRLKRARAFTLVELMVVVAIVGILSVIAVVGYRKITVTAKITEAQNMISAIRIAQEDFKVERGIYANLGNSTFCPTDGTAPSGIKKTAWQPTCSGGLLPWANLPVHVDGPVLFGYATVAAPGAPPALSWIAGLASAPTNRPWYVIQAQADIDGNGGLMTELVGTSYQNTIFSRQEGE